MAGVNKVILVGNLGKDPEVKYFASGDAYCNTSLATSEKWKDKETGEMKEHVEWHKLFLQKRQAEVLGEYCKKGDPIYVEGSLKTRSYEKDGATQYTTEINVRDFQMLGSRRGDGERREPEKHEQSKPAGKPAAAQSDFDDDVPF